MILVYTIKGTQEPKSFQSEQIVKNSYRPFYNQYFYFDKHFNGMTYQWFDILNENDTENKYIDFSA